MAKKAKRRGRPPGAKGAKSPDKMDIGQLRQYIDGLETLLKRKVGEQRAYFEDKLSELSGYASAKAARAVRAITGVTRQGPKKGTRKKAEPKYRSRENSKIVWSGRGVTPVWMREEMKGTKLKKEDFLINKA